MKLPKYLFQRSTSDTIYCNVRVWDSQSDRFVLKEHSTKTSDPLLAQKTQQELQSVADLARHGNSEMTRAHAFGIVNAILAWHGVPEITDDKLIEPKTWGEYSAEWLANQLAIKGDTATYRQYRGQIGAFAPYEETPLKDITRQDCQDFYNDLIKERAAKTCKNTMACIRRVFNQAVADELISSNPVAKITQALVIERQDDPFTSEDMAKIHNGAAVMRNSDDWIRAIIISSHTGCRLADAVNMRVGNFQEQHGIPVISYLPSKTARYGESARVTIPLHGTLQDIASGLSGMRESDLVTPDLSRVPVNGRGGLSDQFMTMLKRERVEMRHEAAKGAAGRAWNSKGFHAFRHTLITNLSVSGCPEDLRKAIVGHSNKNDSHSRYNHTELQLQQMNEYLDKAMGLITCGVS